MIRLFYHLLVACQVSFFIYLTVILAGPPPPAILAVEKAKAPSEEGAPTPHTQTMSQFGTVCKTGRTKPVSSRLPLPFA